MIEKNIIKDRKLGILVGIIFASLAVLFFYLGFNILCLICIVIISFVLYDGFKQAKYHHLLLNWLNKNPNSTIFIYSSKKKYESLIENRILHQFPANFKIIKNDNAVITGNIPLHIYYELQNRIGIFDLPLVVKFEEYNYSVTHLKDKLKLVLNGDLSSEELISEIKKRL